MTEPTIRGDGPHPPDPAPTGARRWPRRLAAALATILLVVGPWPVDDSSFVGSEYQARTLERLDTPTTAPAAGPIRVGVAEVDLTPDSPRPLAGFIGQARTPYAGVDTPCTARALTVESGSGAITILAADLLLIDARLARAVVDRAGLGPDRVFFTASHTHAGPGGWGEHPLERLVAGPYDPAYFDSLAGRLADAVRRSRAAAEPAEMAFVQVEAIGRQKNRVDPAMPTHDALSALVFRPTGGVDGAPPLAILAVFGAHATVSHPSPPRLGGDYPAALVAELKRRTGARSVLFASGAVGDASPARPRAATSSRAAEALGRSLADDLMAALPSARFAREVEVAGLRLDVDLPPVRLPFFAAGLRFSPLITWWIADRRTHLHALRIGPAALVGFPGDYSGELAGSLVGSTRASGVSAVATSFDGDYRGYLVSAPVFRRRACYETRWMNFYGPWGGEYLTDTARRMVGRLTLPGSGPGAPGPDRAPADLAPRIALAGLLAATLAVGRRGLRGAAGRAGVVSVAAGAAAVIAFGVDPGLVDWGKVGIPAPIRWAGLPAGVLALTGLRGRSPGRAAALLAAAFALLASSWFVALIALRAGLRGGRRPMGPVGRTPAPAPISHPACPI